MSEQLPVGSIGWIDITVDDASSLRDFYRDVTGWDCEGHSMGDYEDFVMKDATGTPVAGVCHAKGANAGVPPQWLLYVTVADLQASVAKAKERGAELVSGPRSAGGYGDIAILKDPAGAPFGLYQAKA